MAKVSKKEIAQAFRNAVPRLYRTDAEKRRCPARRCGNEFICHAIFDGNNTGTYESKAITTVGAAARRVIEKRIRPYGTINSWLRHQGVEIWNGDIQVYRHAWLQQLIQEFDNK